MSLYIIEVSVHWSKQHLQIHKYEHMHCKDDKNKVQHASPSWSAAIWGTLCAYHIQSSNWQDTSMYSCWKWMDPLKSVQYVGDSITSRLLLLISLLLLVPLWHFSEMWSRYSRCHHSLFILQRFIFAFFANQVYSDTCYFQEVAIYKVVTEI